MHIQKLISAFIFLLLIIPSIAQKYNSDSSLYLKLFKEYEKISSTDRKKGIEIAEQIEQLAIKNKNPFFVADARIKKAILYYYESDLDKSKENALESISNANAANNKKVLLRAYNLIGAIYYNLADFKNSEQYYLKKIALAKQFKDTVAEMGTYYNIGLIYFQQGNYLKSAEYNFIALDYFKRTKDTFNVLSSLQSIGYTYMNLEDVPTSLKFYKEALNLFRAYNDDYQLAGLLIDISSSFRKQNKPDSAMYYVNQALKISSKQKDNFHFSIATDAKAALYFDNKNYSQALILSKEALKTNQISQLQMAECQNYGTISTIYTQLKNI